MPTLTQAQGAKGAALTFTPALAGLTSGSYAVSGTINQGSAIPLDQTIEAEATSPTIGGGGQCVLFMETSLDGGTTWTGPATRATASDSQENLIGSIPVTVAAARASKSFSILGLPVSQVIRIVAKNDTGVTLTSGAVYLAPITGVST
jgi:hypothetical protein